jgi:hypothetical protein
MVPAVFLSVPKRALARVGVTLLPGSRSNLLQAERFM